MLLKATNKYLRNFHSALQCINRDVHPALEISFGIIGPGLVSSRINFMSR